MIIAIKPNVKPANTLSTQFQRSIQRLVVTSQAEIHALPAKKSASLLKKGSPPGEALAMLVPTPAGAKVFCFFF
jgi:hypothetical protein